MPGPILFANYANTTLAGAINNTATTLVVQPGTGALFPSPVSGQYFLLTLNDASTGEVYEIVQVTNVTVDTMTIVRGQEGTTAQSWLAGDFASNNVTAGSLAAFDQRIKLPADTTFYVSLAGSDSTGDGSIGNPWQTRQFAYYAIQRGYDINGFVVTIQLADNTYNDTAYLGGPIIGQTSYLDVVFQGNLVTPANCFLNTTNGTGFVADQGAKFTVRGFKFEATGSGVDQGCALILGSGGSTINWGNCEFGTVDQYHALSQFGGSLFCEGSYVISGGAVAHIVGSSPGSVIFNPSGSPMTITVNGTPSFTGAFAQMADGAVMIIPSPTVTFAGPPFANGVRYTCSNNGGIDTFGGGPNFLPGNVGGTVNPGSNQGFYS